MQVLAHPAPMKRHTQYVQPARLEVVPHGNGGDIQLILTHADGKTQRVIVDAAAKAALSSMIAEA